MVLKFYCLFYCFIVFKVECKNVEKGIVLKVILFDFMGNDFCVKFKSFCYLVKVFVDCCKELIWGKYEVLVQSGSLFEKILLLEFREERGGCLLKLVLIFLLSEQRIMRKVFLVLYELNKSFFVLKKFSKVGIKRKVFLVWGELSESFFVLKKFSVVEQFEELEELKFLEVEFL